jgi:hypothetical protein
MRLGLELHPHKIPDLLVDAVADLADKLVLATYQMETDAEGDRHFELQARSGRRDVLEKGIGPLSLALFIGPAGLDHVCAHHANFRTLIPHTIIISARPADIFTGATPGRLNGCLTTFWRKTQFPVVAQ